MTSFMESNERALTSTPVARDVMTWLVLAWRVASKVCRSWSSLHASSYESRSVLRWMLCGVKLMVVVVEVSEGLVM